jgi:hypothetical protein
LRRNEWRQLRGKPVHRRHRRAPGHHEATVCRNSSGTVIFVGKFSPTISQFEPPLEEIVSISVRSQSDTRLSPSVIVFQAEVVFNVCLDPVNRANCRTFLHTFFGTANDRRGVAGTFTFGEVI